MVDNLHAIDRVHGMLRRVVNWKMGWAGLILLGVLSADGQYSIDWFSVDGGGGTSTGGDYSITGTIGQADAGKSSGAGYELIGGFMSIVVAIQTPGAPQLTIVRNGTQLEVSWPEDAAGFELEEASALGATPATTSWSNTAVAPVLVEGIRKVTVPAPVGKKFYRLRKP